MATTPPSRRRSRHVPLGPNGTWKTGQRVPFTSRYVDQYGVPSTHFVGDTFPPCVGRKGVCAYRKPVSVIGRAIS